MSHQQAFDILEAFAYTKKGNQKTHFNILEYIKNQFDMGTTTINDVDEAILLANAVVEMRPLAKKGSQMHT